MIRKLWLAAGFAAGLANAHFIYLMPQKFAAQPGERILVSVHSGDEFPRGVEAADPNRLVARVIAGDGIVPLGHFRMAGKATHTAAPVVPGSQWLVVNTTPRIHTMEGEKFQSYLRDEGLDATAVGNNQSITSDVPVFLHDGQFVAEVKDRYRDHYSSDSLARSMPSGGGGHCYRDCGPDGNLHTDIAGLFLLGAVAGIFEEAEITAKSTVTDVKNVSVDNSSTAVANNLSVNLASDNPANHVVIADITQFAIANVKAETSTTYVSATGYDHMRQLTTATLSPTDGDPTRVIQVPTRWVSSTATAVGNNASITVGPVLAE